MITEKRLKEIFIAVNSGVTIRQACKNEAERRAFFREKKRREKELDRTSEYKKLENSKNVELVKENKKRYERITIAYLEECESVLIDECMSDIKDPTNKKILLEVLKSRLPSWKDKKKQNSVSPQEWEEIYRKLTGRKDGNGRI